MNEPRPTFGLASMNVEDLILHELVSTESDWFDEIIDKLKLFVS